MFPDVRCHDQSCDDKVSSDAFLLPGHVHCQVMIELLDVLLVVLLLPLEHLGELGQAQVYHGFSLLQSGPLQHLLIYLSHGGILTVQWHVGISEGPEAVCLIVDVAVSSGQQLTRGGLASARSSTQPDDVTSTVRETQ